MPNKACVSEYFTRSWNKYSLDEFRSESKTAISNTRQTFCCDRKLLGKVHQDVKKSGMSGMTVSTLKTREFHFDCDISMISNDVQLCARSHMNMENYEIHMGRIDILFSVGQVKTTLDAHKLSWESHISGRLFTFYAEFFEETSVIKHAKIKRHATRKAINCVRLFRESEGSQIEITYEQHYI
jgi:hypothetical protein